MRGHYVAIFAVALSAICLSGLTSAAPAKAQPVCPDDQSGDVIFFPNPSNCSEYFACDNGILTLMECPDDLQWNTEINVCDHPENVECEVESKVKALPVPRLAEPICPEDPSGNVTFFPNPANCSEYYACDNGVLTIMECPDDLQWNTEINVCDHPENVECEVESKVKALPVPRLAEPICPEDPSGNVTFFPNPANCSEYYACDNGVLTIMECPDDLQWNTEINVCDHPENVECEVESKVKALPLLHVAEPVCPEDPSGNVTFFPNPANCSEYYACDNGILTIMECPDDLQWNTEINVCDHPENVECEVESKVKALPVPRLAKPVCPEDPSGNVTFFPNPANCSEYYACDNGILTIMECPDDLQWNTEINVCDHPENVECEVESKVKALPVLRLAEPVCPEDPSGNVTFFPNPANCSEYYACDNGILTIMECPDDLQWNTEINVCDHPENVECEVESKVKALPVPRLAEPVCPEDPSGNVTFFPNPANCSEYYACDNGILTIMECPDDLQWNTEINVCDHPENVECEVESRIQSLQKVVPKIHKPHHKRIHHHHATKFVELRRNHYKHH